MSIAKRDYRLDGIKFLLICLVVIGHYLEPCRYNNYFCCVLYSLIYMIHMPLFVMLSGYFCGSLTIKKLEGFSLRMVEIILVIMVGMALIIKPTWQFLLSFNYPLWFLLCLIYWKAYTYLLDSLKVSYGWQVIISFTLAVLGFLFLDKDAYFLSISRSLQFLPFFTIGRWLKHNQFKSNKYLFAILAIGLALLCIFFSGRAIHVFEFNRDGIFDLASQTKLPIYLCLILKPLLFIVLIYVCIAAINMVRMPKLFERYGQYTLAIFCFHCYTYPLVVTYTRNLGLELFLSLLSIIIFTLMAKHELFSKFISNPLSSIYGITARKNSHVG